MAEKVFILTEDGSHTLLNTVMNEHYHSTHGAIQESKHVFIKTGFEAIVKKKAAVSILEIGFGTGLNAYLTLHENRNLSKKISYTAVEAFPVSQQEALQLNYPQLLINKSRDSLFEKLHTSGWNEESRITENFQLTKWYTSIQEMEFKQKFDLIYFDAFSPAAQPEMWTEEIFSKLFFCLNEEGLLVTYCAKGEVKRALKKVGFMVTGLPGPPGKREMTAAYKTIKV